MSKADQTISVKVRDRVTFDINESIPARYVAALRRDFGELP